jgi:hypothetical protein
MIRAVIWGGTHLVVESRMYQALLTPPTSKHTLGQRAFLRQRCRHAPHPYTANEVLGPTVGQWSCECESMRELFLSVTGSYW